MQRTGIKTTLLALAFLALAAASAWCVFNNMGIASAGLANLENQQRRHAAAESLLVHAKGASDSLVQLLVTTERDDRVPLYQKIDADNAMAERSLTDLLSLSARAEQKESLAQLQAMRTEFLALFVASVEEIELNGAQGALAQFWGKTRDALEKLSSASEAFAKTESTDLQRVRGELAAEEMKRMLAAGLAVLALLLAAALGAALFRALSVKPA